jgi:hypothetical protein
MKKQIKRTLLINRKKFLNWYFDDADTLVEFLNDHKVIESIIKNGRFTLTAEDVLKQCGYFPKQVAQRGQGRIPVDDCNEVDLTQYDEVKFAE